MRITGRQAATALVGLRLAVGAGAWLLPETTGSLFGIPAARNPGAPFLARLFGVRDVALGGLLATSKGATRTRLLQVGVAVDASDSVAAVVAGASRQLPAAGAALSALTAAAAAALGVVALRDL